MLDAIETDDARYVALTPVFDDPEDQVNDDGSLIIMKEVEEPDGELYYVEIEDDEEYETVGDAFIARLQDYYEIDEV